MKSTQAINSYEKYTSKKLLWKEHIFLMFINGIIK